MRCSLCKTLCYLWWVLRILKNVKKIKIQKPQKSWKIVLPKYPFLLSNHSYKQNLIHVHNWTHVSTTAVESFTTFLSKFLAIFVFIILSNEIKWTNVIYCLHVIANSIRVFVLSIIFPFCKLIKFSIFSLVVWKNHIFQHNSTSTIRISIDRASSWKQ